MARATERLRPGDAVQIRGERWRITREQIFSACSLIDAAGADPSNRGTSARFILPFDRAIPATAALQRPRIVRAPVLRRTVRHLLATATPDWTSLRAAANARLSLLPFQLEPALAMTHGLGTRLLLADDVGLGKTIQAALILAEIRAREPGARALIVTPAGVREQWRDELAERFHIAADVFDAGGLARAATRLPSGVNPWSVAPVVITSIDFVKQPDVIRSLEALVWDLVAFDEAHGLAGRSDRATAAGLLAARARRVLLLTATPHSGDDRSFAALCALGRMGDDDEPILMFRRSRTEAGCMPARRTSMLGVRLTAAERRMHVALDAYARRVWRDAPLQCVAGARLAMGVLARRAASSPAALARSIDRRIALLFDAPSQRGLQLELPLDEDRETADAEPGRELGTPGLSSPEVERGQLDAIRTLATEATSAESKVEALRRLLRRVGEPAIVFTEYRDTLDHLARALGAEDEPRLHGGMDAAERRRELRRFTAGDARILLATDAASEGLNLQRRCRLIVNLEVPWTPLRFEQRVGRVDRLGQQRRTHAVTLVSRETLEESVVARFHRRMQHVRRAAPFRSDLLAAAAFGGESAAVEEAPADAMLPPGVQVVSLREHAAAEATRLAGSIRLGEEHDEHAPDPGRDRRIGRPTGGSARPPAALLGHGRERMDILWALRLLFVDERDGVLWETIAGARAAVRLRHRPRRPCLLRDDLDAILRSAGLDMSGRMATAHACLLDRVTRAVASVTAGLLRREQAIAAEIRRTTGRLALPLVQPGLFDRRALRQAAAQRLLAEDALANAAERIGDLRRLRAPREGDRTLLFIACTDA